MENVGRAATSGKWQWRERDLQPLKNNQDGEKNVIAAREEKKASACETKTQATKPRQLSTLRSR